MKLDKALQEVKAGRDSDSRAKESMSAAEEELTKLRASEAALRDKVEKAAQAHDEKAARLNEALNSAM